MVTRTAKRWIVKGDVQGVGFRFFVQHKATALGLTGWAKNLENGTVEVYAVGSPTYLSDLAESLKEGPQQARVESVDEQDQTPEHLSGFCIR